MAITPEMIERFKAAYPAAKSATQAAREAAWPEYDAKHYARIFVSSLGLPPKVEGDMRRHGRAAHLGSDEAVAAIVAIAARYPEWSACRLAATAAARMRAAEKRRAKTNGAAIALATSAADITESDRERWRATKPGPFVVGEG